MTILPFRLSPSSVLPHATAGRSARDLVVLDYGLTAQQRLAPYAFGFFGIGAPLFLYLAASSVPVWHVVGYLAMFALNWSVFWVLRRRVKELGAEAARHVHGRLWRQGLAGGLWTLSLLLICLTAGATGPRAEMLLMVCAAAAAGLTFFYAPVLIYLLVLAPLAMAGPILALHAIDGDGQLTQIMTGGLALALAMAFVLNRHMQEHYLLQHGQMAAAAEREAARAATDALSDAKMALMETLSRELRTGLKGVEHTLGQSLGHLNRAPAPRAFVEAALGEVGRLHAILTTTLDNDIAEAGQIELVLEPLDIDLIARRIISGVSDTARQKGLAVIYSPQGLPGTGAAIGDAHRVEQVIAHLVGNAVLYTPAGRVELKLLTVDDALRIEVVDSGPGLTPDELALAFAPHARILRTSAGQPGAGLGLSLSRTLGELMHGQVDGQSTPDVGSKFWLDLPFDRTASAPARPIETEETVLTGDEMSLRVLLISNDSLRAAQLRDELERLGHKCLTSTTRERALTLARKGPIDACLISTGAFESLDDDGNRAQLDGFLSSLRQSQAEARMNILALLPDGEQAEALKALGVQPLRLPQEREALRRALLA